MSLVAHGGVAGTVIELVLVVGLVAVFVAVYLRERRSRREENGR